MILERLSRKTTSGWHLAELDGLRFIAIFSVAMFHLAGYIVARSSYSADVTGASRPVDLAGHGHFGVQMFFVISGFILSLPFMHSALGTGPKVNLSKYYLRRLTRLEPPYVISLLFFFVMLVALHRFPIGDLLESLAASVVYLHGLIFKQLSIINCVAWSLEIEIQFYILMPLLASAFLIRLPVVRRFVLVSLAMSAAVAQHFYVAADPLLSLTVVNQIQYFLAGMFLADVYAANKAPRINSRLWDPVCLALPVVAFVLFQSMLWTTFLFPWLLALAYWASFRSVYVSRVLRLPFISGTGLMCYSIYLLHYPLISFIGAHTVRFGGSHHLNLYLAIQSLVVLPLIWAVSYLFFVLVERPCMNPRWPFEVVAYLSHWARHDRPTAISPTPPPER